MRLRRVSHLIVSSVLASCGGGGGGDAHSVVTIPPPSATTAHVDPPHEGVMDVVPTDPNSKMRFVSLADIVAAFAPIDPNRVALYAVDPVSDGLQRVYGPSAEDACIGALRALCTNPGATRWISIAKDGTITRGTFAELDTTRAAQPMMARALAEVSKIKTAAGVWFIDGQPAPFPLPMLDEDVALAPSEDAMPIIARVGTHVARLRSLHGDQRERELLALRLPAVDRAILRTVLIAGTESSTIARMTPLARGWCLETLSARSSGCGSGASAARYVVLGSNVVVDVRSHAYSRPCKGRRPPSWAFTQSGRFFEDAAAMEAASIDAFDLVARELESFGAPATLVDRARSAARDEVRHAAIMSKRAGVAPPPHTRGRTQMRTPFEAALDNAVEGCVNESFAAIIARFQSVATNDEELAREFASIADDECNHGDLAHDIAAWLEPRLTSAERDRISSAREHAKRLLVANAFEASGATDDLTREALGLPSRAQATALANAFVAFTE